MREPNKAAVLALMAASIGGFDEPRERRPWRKMTSPDPKHRKDAAKSDRRRAIEKKTRKAQRRK